jgi:hypothetical protein
MLRCEECGREARTGEDARGWRAFLTDDPAAYEDVTDHAHDDEAPIVTVYCPECADREFG